MGTEYYLFNPESKERFDLGKGAWFSVFQSCGEFVLPKGDEYKLYKSILGEVAPSFDESITLGYFKELVRKIIAWGKEMLLLFFADEAFYDEHSQGRDGVDFDKEYPITGTRYKE